MKICIVGVWLNIGAGSKVGLVVELHLVRMAFMNQMSANIAVLYADSLWRLGVPTMSRRQHLGWCLGRKAADRGWTLAAALKCFCFVANNIDPMREKG